MAMTDFAGARSLPIERAPLAVGPDYRPAPGVRGARPLPILRAIGPRARVDADYGPGRIVSTVKREDTPVDVPLRRLVRCMRERDGKVMRETWSDAATGAYAFEQLPLGEVYTVLSYDYEHGFLAAVADNLKATAP